MADIKFSEFPKATTSKDSDEIAILQDGVNKMIPSPVLESKIINKTVSRVIEQGGASLNVVNLKGVVPTYADLALITPTPELNDAYQVEADGLVYVYTENGFQAEGEGIMVQPTPAGLVEEGNPNAVSGGEVFESLITKNDAVKQLENSYKIKDDKLNQYIDLSGSEVSAPSPNTFITKYYNIKDVSKIELTTSGWEGSDQVSVVSAYDEFGQFLDNLLSATSIIGQDIISMPIIFPVNTRYIKVTERADYRVYLNFTPAIKYINDNYIGFQFPSGIITDLTGIQTDKTTELPAHRTQVYNKNFINPDIFEFTVSLTTHTVRCFFGNENFFHYLVFTTDIPSSILTFQLYNSSNGSLVDLGSVSNPDITSILKGDKIKIVKVGECYTAYINNVLIGAVDSIDYMNISKPYYAGVMFRNKSDVARFKDLNYSYLNLGKKAHISCDDFNSVLQEVVDDDLSSIWDNSVFAYLKSMNAKYGAVFSLYLFKNYPNFDISNFPVKYKNEFQKASNWLKFGFHAREDIHYINETVETTVIDYTSVYNEIVRFAGESSVDYIPRFHYYSVKREAVNELANLGLIKGLLTADDNRTVNCGLTTAEISVVNNCDLYIDYIRNLKFYNTSYRFDGDTATSSEERIQNIFQDKNNSSCQVLYFHEAYLINAQDSITKMIETLHNLNYNFDFPQNYIN